MSESRCKPQDRERATRYIGKKRIHKTKQASIQAPGVSRTRLPIDATTGCRLLARACASRYTHTSRIATMMSSPSGPASDGEECIHYTFPRTIASARSLRPGGSGTRAEDGARFRFRPERSVAPLPSAASVALLGVSPSAVRVLPGSETALVVVWLAVGLLAGDDRRLWLVVGVTAGIGLENKDALLFLVPRVS